jgi:hypothetical protein
MELAMSGTIVIRILLFLALMITAHAFKPFSIKNVTQHLIYSTRSFAFVLPQGTRTIFDQANSLALNLSENLFDNDLTEMGVTDQMMALQTERQKLQPAARIWTPDEPVKPVRKTKPAVRRSAPAKRVERNDRFDAANIAAVIDDEIRQVADEAVAYEVKERDDAGVTLTPVILPVITEDLSWPQVLPVGFLGALERVGCSEQKIPLRRMIAAIQVTNQKRLTLQLLGRSKTVAPECEGEKPDSGETEAIAPEVEAPVQEEAQPEEKQPEEQETPPSPLKCPSDPMVPHE